MKTIICDIDGTILKYFKNHYGIINNEPKVLPGVVKKMNNWENDGHKIILITGRRENLREITEKQLTNIGIPFDFLIMGCADKGRVLINDEDKVTKAYAISLKRDSGFENIDWASVGLK